MYCRFKSKVRYIIYMHDAKKKKKHPLQLVGALSNRGYILNAVRVVYICPLLPCVCLICSVFEKKNISNIPT